MNSQAEMEGRVRAAAAGHPAGAMASGAAPVRAVVSPSCTVTLTDERPDVDGFGHADSDALLCGRLAEWLGGHDGHQLVSCHLVYDGSGRRQLVAVVESWEMADALPTASLRLLD